MDLGVDEMNQDGKILRGLAARYSLALQGAGNAEKERLHRAGNDLHMVRPVVLVDELPWHELNQTGELTLCCEDPYLREVECWLRRELFQFKHFRADRILRPFVPVGKVVRATGIGLTVDERQLATDRANHIVSHEYHDQLATPEDLEKLHKATVVYDEAETARRWQLVGDLVGDILPVKKVGIDHISLNPWDDIARFRGVTPLLISLAEEPEFCHQIMRRVTDIAMDIAEQYRQLGLFENMPASLHCTPVLTDDLAPMRPDEGPVGYESLWGRGTEQIFASVSKAMHEEFDIEYMKDTIGRCGLVYYGCCEPLDKKIDIVEKIPHLRKISITPWADVDIAAEAIGRRYVLSAKPNPAAVGVSRLDEEALRRELGHILSACKRNGCACELILKDISTCCGRPENIFEWARIAMEMVNAY